jgi:putative methyltransferase (TIGR04325 family)
MTATVESVRMLSRQVARYLRRRLPVSSPDSQGIDFKGDYTSWSEAERHSTGYAAAVILERTREALLRIKRGEAVYERDSVLFDRPEYAFPVLTGLLRAALMRGGRLCVVDFGGSLGSSYFQHRRFLSSAAGLEWCVIEQPSHVACGREHFEDGQLRFYETVEECLAHHRPDVLLLSGVLQYLPDPYAALERLLAHSLRHVIIDRTAFLEADRDRLTVQTVPEWIYPASYPAWFLSETRLTQTMTAARYGLVADFPGSDDVSPEGEPAYFKGFIYEHKDPS